MPVFTLALLVVMFAVGVSANNINKLEMSIKENDTQTHISNGFDTEIGRKSRNPCPKGFTLLRDRRRKMWCVFIGPNSVSWFEALLICKLVVKDAILMELYDPVIAKNVQTLVYKHDEVNRYRGYWVGGNNFIDNSTFVWTNSGKPVARDLWDTNEPSYTNHAEYCTELRAWNGKLNDAGCHGRWMNYVCGKRVYA